MKDSREFWIRDLEQLLDETIVTDAVAEIMGKFDEAIQALPAQSRDLIARYFDGATLEQLGLEHRITLEQMEQWMDRIKRELAHQLRIKCQVKQ